MRTILVGCGGISNSWLTAAQEIGGIEFVALVDLDKEAARAQAEKYGLEAPAYDDLDAALSDTKPEIAFDCTIPAAHAMVDTQCLRAGCHVLVEKPLADSMAAAREVVATAAEVGRTHAVLQNRRYNPEIVRYRDALELSELGSIHTLYGDFFVPAHFGGFRAEMDHVLLLDMAIHTFDEARFLLGARPSRVSCHEWNPPGSWYTHGASAIVTAEMSDGSVFNYRGSWCAEGHMTSWEAEWRAIGTWGSALWDGHSQVDAERVTDPEPANGGDLVREAVGVRIPERESMRFTGHAGCIEEFVRTVRSGETPMTVSSDNYYSLAMSLCAVESAEQQRPVEVEQL